MGDERAQHPDLHRAEAATTGLHQGRRRGVCCAIHGAFDVRSAVLPAQQREELAARRGVFKEAPRITLLVIAAPLSLTPRQCMQK